MFDDHGKRLSHLFSLKVLGLLSKIMLVKIGPCANGVCNQRSEKEHNAENIGMDNQI